MKFLCDRCKTRYSIGDDRVRGKILKIRCKNCANVITVREGMPDADAAPEPQRGQKRTTLAPAAASIAPAPANGAHSNGSSPGTALGAAFATAMTKPPPALEEEWYVSIDGDQAGPYTLAEAQRWVGGKPFDADLHCWSEGFDDWLPVDKVSHFRGLRKKPAPAPQPPPRPPVPAARPPGLVSREGLAGRPHEPMRIDESEPKPLFAATMASLEKSSSTSSSANINLSAMAAAAAAPAMAPPANGAPRNGAAARATPPKGTPVLQAHGNGIAPPPALPRPGGALPRGNTTGDPSTVRGVGVPASVRPGTAPGVGKPGQTTLGFDSSELAESATQIETAPFADEQQTAAEPVASRMARPGLPAAAPAPAPVPPARPDVFAQAMAARAPAPAPAPTPSYAPPKFGVTDSLTALESDSAATAPRLPNPVAPPPKQQDDDADIDIGEVSRVVKLADIVPRSAGQQQQRRSGPIGTTTSMNVNRAATNATGPVNRVNATGSVARINATGSVARINTTGAVAKLDALPNTFAVESPQGSLEPAVVTASPVQAQHKRGLVLLLLGAAVLIGVAIVVVFMVFMKEDEDRATQTAVVDDYSIDSTRPDQIPAPKNGSGSQAIIPTPGSGSEKKPVGPNQTKITPWKPPDNGSGTTRPKIPDPPDPPPGAAKLDTGEVEAMARSTNGATSTCFIRSNKGTEAILLADVKRVPVDFTIAPDGTVKSASIGVEAGLVKLSNCLRGVVGTWRFRPSAGGNYRIILVPPS